MLVDELRGEPLDEAMIAGMRTLGDAYRFASIPPGAVTGASRSSDGTTLPTISRQK